MNKIDLDDFTELATARKLWSEGRVIKAMEAFETARNQRPKNVRGLLEFAKALGLQHEIFRAEALLKQALQISTGHSRAELAIAQTLRSIYRPEQALALLESLRQKNQLPPPAIGELATLYEQFGRYEDALEAINQCVAAAPDRGEPKRIQGRVLRRLKRFDDAERTLMGLTNQASAPAMQTVGVWTELGHLHDALGDYEAALAAIERAKDVLRALPNTKRLIEQSQRLNQLFARLYEQIDEQTILRWTSVPREDSHSDGETQIAHLLGFPRTGTTLLEQVLDAHPAITCAPERVIFSKLFFPRLCQNRTGGQSIDLESLDDNDSKMLKQLRSEYVRLHGEVHGGLLNRILIDKNPNHTSLIAGLLRLSPNTHFISVRRDPRDVLVSCYLRTFPLSEYSVAFLDWQSTREMYDHESRILERMKELLSDRWIEVDYETLVDDLYTVSDRVVSQLGIQPSDATRDYLSATKEKVVNSPTQADVRQPVYKNRVGRWKNYERLLSF